jgi:hypothetical protein
MGCAAFAAVLSLTACPAAEPTVTYGGEAGSEVYGGAGSAAVGGSAARAGAGGISATGGTGGSKTSTGGASGSVAAGAGGNGSGGGTGGLSSVTFDVTTVAQGGKYQPKNIGAIWIETSSGSFVRSLEVWAKTRRRYLTKFNTAAGTTGTVDVTASATLTSHKAHHVTWDLKDKTGAAVAAGAYRVVVEVTDADTTGKNYSFDFNTSAGVQSLSVPNQTYFNTMTLKVQ